MRALLALLGVVLVVGTSPVSTADEVKTRKSQLELKATLCEPQQRLAVSAVALRDQGKSRAEMERPLPPRGPDNNQLARLMYEILDDVYGYPRIGKFPYYVYRTELCFRHLEGKPNPAGFRVVVPGILACQKKHGLEPSHGIVDCIREAVIQGASVRR